MTKVERQLMARGQVYEVECGVCRDGSSPAWDFFEDLCRGEWAQDPDASEFPDDSQIHDYDIFLEYCQQLAEEGLPVRRTAVNYLQNGIWEFKRGAKRLTFYDTPGNGTFRPKDPISDIRDSDYPEDDMWWFPDFDDHIRLGHAFPKNSQKTDPQDINSAERVRMEDLAHDK